MEPPRLVPHRLFRSTSRPNGPRTFEARPDRVSFLTRWVWILRRTRPPFLETLPRLEANHQLVRVSDSWMHLPRDAEGAAKGTPPPLFNLPIERHGLVILEPLRNIADERFRSVVEERLLLDNHPVIGDEPSHVARMLSDRDSLVALVDESPATGETMDDVSDRDVRGTRFEHVDDTSGVRRNDRRDSVLNPFLH